MLPSDASQSEQYGPVSVELSCDFPGTEILLIDGQQQLITRNIQQIKIDVLPGIYTARVRIGNSLRDKHIVVRPDKPYSEVLDPPPISSAIPLNVSTKSHEYHQSAVSNAATTAAETVLHADGNSGIFVVLREWTPDGKRVLFRTDRDGPTSLWWQPVDGSAPAERLTPPDSPPVLEGIVTPDGKTLVYRVDRPAPALRDILAIPLTGERTPVPVLATEFDELSPRVSPDGKWMAYVSTESGRDEVYVRPFPSGGGRTLVSTDGGREPLWSRDGKRVFFRRDEIIFAATVTLGSEAVVTRRDTAAAGSYSTTRFHPQYDVAPDGRLLVLERFQPVMSATIVLNWGAALAARLGPVR